MAIDLIELYSQQLNNSLWCGHDQNTFGASPILQA